ncbi:hypothetical protein ThimaDRAFT_3459 [Thiocapsa marina 5811]|uniref:Uncharacterized protein n=1 Tax=Thiocapsa marina 5811 TaxID=768671 RepID=F9UEV6_9GAMM|nr:hypothetical protein ThimaDRAFT_3459 [Thiocapsa marina 5811]
MPARLERRTRPTSPSMRPSSYSETPHPSIALTIGSATPAGGAMSLARLGTRDETPNPHRGCHPSSGAHNPIARPTRATRIGTPTTLPCFVFGASRERIYRQSRNQDKSSKVPLVVVVVIGFRTNRSFLAHPIDRKQRREAACPRDRRLAVVLLLGPRLHDRRVGQHLKGGEDREWMSKTETGAKARSARFSSASR